MNATGPAAVSASEQFDMRGAGLYRKTTKVEAHEATESGQLDNDLHFEPGDLITTNWDGSQGVVAKDIWPQTYAAVPGEPDTYYKTALAEAVPYYGPPRPFQTLEGDVWMHPRDHVLQVEGGKLNDRYPVKYDFIRKNYVTVRIPDPPLLRAHQIEMLARVCHDVWRAPKRIGLTHRYAETWRAANDPEWTNAHDGRTVVDLANADYADLPEFWKQENRKSAGFALDWVYTLLATQIPFNHDVVRGLAAGIHAAWSDRRTDRSEEARATFELLPVEEQAKSLTIANWAINMLMPIEIESRVLFHKGDAKRPGELGPAIDGGLAPKKLSDIKLPDDVIGFRFRDIVRVQAADGPIELSADQSSLFLPGAQELIKVPARMQPRLEPWLNMGVRLATTRVTGIVIPMTWTVIPVAEGSHARISITLDI